MKMKMKLDDLKVNSFVTTLENEKAQTANGGKSTPLSTPLTPITFTFSVTTSILTSDQGC